MLYKAKYNIPKPVKCAFARKANGKEPYFDVADFERYEICIPMFSETGEQALFVYQVKPDSQTNEWQFLVTIYKEEPVYEIKGPVSLDSTLCIQTEEDEFVIQFVEFMSDYNENEFAFLKECFFNGKIDAYAFPDQETMFDIVEQWHQGQFIEFLRGVELYQDTHEKEIRLAKTGNPRKADLEKWIKRHKIMFEAFRPALQVRPSKMYRVFGNIHPSDLTKEVFYSLMQDVAEMEKYLYLRTNPREVLKRKSINGFLKYGKYLVPYVFQNSTNYMPFPFCLSAFEYVRHNREFERIPVSDLISYEELEYMVQEFEKLDAAAQRLSERFRTASENLTSL